MKKKINLDTASVHSGDDCNETNAVVPPVWHTVNYVEKSIEHLAVISAEDRPVNFYPRYNNPLNDQLSKQLAALEGTEDALVTGTGMGAISSAIISMLKSGDHIVAQKNLYAGTMKLMRDILPRFGVTTTFVEQEDNKGFDKAITPDTKIIYVETPSNPLMKITDLKFIGRLGRKSKLITMIDNTFATPANQNPSEFGFDIILHSATKFLGGHYDLMAGVVCGSKKLVSQVWDYAHIAGHNLSAFDGSLLLRGLKTFSLRMKKHNENAKEIAEFLSRHKKVKNVYYPGLKSFSQHSLAKSQMKGYGGMLSFELKSDYEGTKKYLESLELCKITVSLGGVGTIVTLPVSMWKPYYTRQQLDKIGLSDSLIRMSVGIEDSSDIIKDLENGFRKF